jgi:hypothetical protein
MGPVLNPSGVKYELADKTRGIAYGGVGLMIKLAREVGLVEAIDRRLRLFRFSSLSRQPPWPALALNAKTPLNSAPRVDEGPGKSPILDRRLTCLTTRLTQRYFSC